jgi:lipoate-protein ligase A
MNDVVLYETESNDPSINLAIEQYLFENKKRGELIFYLWQNDNTIVIGRYQNAYEEINMEFVRDNGIKVVRRDTGGGAVYHDMGNLNYSFITDADCDSLEICINVLRKVLEKFNIEYSMEGRNDILVDGCKISGTARYDANGKTLHHGTLLINSNLEIIKNALTRSNKISDTKTTKSKPRKVGNLSDYNPKLNIQSVKQAFSSELGIGFKMIPALTPRVQELVATKFNNEEWTYGFQPAYNFKNEKHYKTGTVRVLSRIEDSIVKSISFTGDFFATGNVKELEQKLIGLNIATQLKNHLAENADGYFLGIAGKEISELFIPIIG